MSAEDHDTADDFHLQIDSRQVELSKEMIRASEKEDKSYTVSICEMRFTIQPNVFSPKYFHSTRVFAEILKPRRNECFLEVGCGSGVLTVLAIKRGAANAVAVDINPLAVQNTLCNVRDHGLLDVIDVRLSDVFSSVHESERFDTILWNAPFVPIETNYSHASPVEMAIFDPGYRAIIRFLKDAPDFLAENGRVLFGFGDFGDQLLFDQLCKRYGYDKELLGKGRGYEGRGVEFLLYELRRSTI